MTDSEAIEIAQNKQLADYLDGNADIERNWEACEGFVQEEIESLSKQLTLIQHTANSIYSISLPDIKDMIVDRIKDIL